MKQVPKNQKYQNWHIFATFPLRFQLLGWVHKILPPIERSEVSTLHCSMPMTGPSLCQQSHVCGIQIWKKEKIAEYVTLKRTCIMSCHNGYPCHSSDLWKTPKFKFKFKI